MRVLLHAHLSCMEGCRICFSCPHFKPVTAEPTQSILGDRTRVSCQGPREPVEGCQTPLLGLKCEQSSRNKHLWTSPQHEVGGGLVEEAVGAFGVNDSDQFICEIVWMFPWVDIIYLFCPCDPISLGVAAHSPLQRWRLRSPREEPVPWVCLAREHAALLKPHRQLLHPLQTWSICKHKPQMVWECGRWGP